jgi:phosphatidylglycerophosphatase A
MISLRPLPSNTSLKQPSTLLATWFGSGLIKPAPGTWGSLASLPFIVLIVFGLPAPYNLMTLCAFILSTFVIGLWVSDIYMRAAKRHDASEIVIDETCGLAISFLALFASSSQGVSIPIWLSVIIIFALFRFYDALKPFPINALDRKVEGALGVMIDDCAAGLFASATYIGGIMLWAHLA